MLRKIYLFNFCLFGICLGCGCSGNFYPISTSYFQAVEEDEVLPPPTPDTPCCDAITAITPRTQFLPTPNFSHPLDMAEMIDIGLRNNPFTKIAWANARATAFNWEASKSQLYPQIVGEGILSHVDQEGPLIVLPKHYNTFFDELTVDYLLLDFGGRSASIEGARQALLTANWMYNRAIQSVIVSVLNSYLNLIGSKAALEAREQDLKDSQTNLDAATRLYQAGVKNRIDFLLAESDFIQAKLALVTVAGQVKTNTGILSNAMGLPASMTFDVLPLPEELPLSVASKDMTELMTIAKQKRPDLEAAYANWQEKKADIVVARSAGLPTLSSTVLLEHTDFFHHSMFNFHMNTSSLVLNIPIFSGFLYENQERAARSRAKQAYAEMKNLESNILLEVVTNYNALLTAEDQIKYSKEFLSYATETYNAVLINYKEGVSSIIDLLKSQGDLSNARAAYIQSRTQWAISLANLAYSTGTLNNKSIARKNKD